LDRSAIESQSVSHAIFEYLFLSSHLGSRKLEWKTLEKYYREWGILDREETIILHMQDFYDPERMAKHATGRKR
jgi:hypothetical protein